MDLPSPTMRVQQLSHVLTERPQRAPVEGISIRNFEDSTDISSWIDLMQAAFAGATPPMRRWTEEDFKNRIMQQSSWSPAHLFLALDCGQLVGSVSLHFRQGEKSALPAVHWLAVHPAWRRRGIARLLVADLERVCWNRGFREVHLETHTGWQAAKHFYEAIGYTTTHQVTERPLMRTESSLSRRSASG